MLDTLQKMSGTTHRTYRDSKTITVNKMRLIGQVEDNQTINMTTKEVPVISYNDMAFISERNSIVFRAGDSPVWNRNEMILPMSWRLFSNTIVHPGHDYSLQTIPTLSSALDFDVRKNQPDFTKMLNKRVEQSIHAEEATQAFQAAYGYSEYQMSQLDPDNVADDIMEVINSTIRRSEEAKNPANTDSFDMDVDESWLEGVEDNTEQMQETAKAAAQQAQKDQKRYAGGLLSREDLISSTGGVNHSLDKEILNAYMECKGDMWQDHRYFATQNSELRGVNGEPYIVRAKIDEDLKKLMEDSKDEHKRVFTEGEVTEKDVSQLGNWQVTDAFYRFLVSMERWDFAKGRFEQAMVNFMNAA